VITQDIETQTTKFKVLEINLFGSITSKVSNMLTISKKTANIIRVKNQKRTALITLSELSKVKEFKESSLF
ncbi:45832_t:CDS:1, partial [Gigaspora margarita]